MNKCNLNRPAPIPGCPPGLEYLTMIDQLNVEQLRSLVEGIDDFFLKQTFPKLKN